MAKEFSITNLELKGIYLSVKNSKDLSDEVKKNFISRIEGYFESLDKQRIEIVAKYSRKDSEGDPIIVINLEGKKVYDVPDEELPNVQKEVQKIVDAAYNLVLQEGEEDIEKFIDLLIRESRTK